MSSVQHLKQFVNERLTAAAEEIFGVFEKTIFQFEEAIDRQRRLLDVVYKPDTTLLKIELPPPRDCNEEEVLADQQLCIQERNSRLDQEEPEPPQMKEEQEDLCISQEGEQLVLNQETDGVTLTPTYEESDHSAGQTLSFNISETPMAVDEKPLNCIWDKSSVVSEANNDHQLISHSSHDAESQDQKREDSGSTRNAEPEENKIHHNSRELPRPRDCNEEEVLADQQLCIQERNSRLDQEEPEPPQMKEEQEDLCISQKGEQLVLNQETDGVTLTPTYEESDHSEGQTLSFSI
ncbi:uncharacterized protein LOC117945425 isoform X2 [Etheostoma cragini]|uniref:uncharacterized protein LOC117945425 isoform X2 n=1 Tax=Etheostoma cragini TaxID=417921 RepID=UPI00155E94F6|nr:uncharacterized protein LOC117945425 isoform X2 [Etheostoma cragini]